MNKSSLCLSRDLVVLCVVIYLMCVYLIGVLGSLHSYESVLCCEGCRQAVCTLLLFTVYGFDFNLDSDFFHPFVLGSSDAVRIIATLSSVCFTLYISMRQYHVKI